MRLDIGKSPMPGRADRSSLGRRPSRRRESVRVAPGCVANERSRPHPDAQNESKGEIQKQHSGAKAVVIPEPADHEGNERTTHDPRAQNPGEGTVMMRD